MEVGVSAAAGRAWQLLRSHPLAWLPWLLVRLPCAAILLVATAEIAGPLLDGSATEVEAGRLVTLGWLLLAAWVVLSAAGQAGCLAVQDRLLREEQASWADFRDGVEQLTAPLALGWLFLVVARLVVALTAAGLFCLLVSGADRELLRSLVAGTAAGPEMLAAWHARGPVWLVGMVAWLAAVGTVGSVLSAGGAAWRLAAAAESAVGLEGLLGAAHCLLARRSWLFRRWCWRWTVRLGLLLVVGEAVSRLAALSAGAPEWLRPVTLAVGLLAAGLTWAIASAWLQLTDLVGFRLAGGAADDPRLATRGARLRRRPERRRRSFAAAVELAVASEPVTSPQQVWRPSPASRPVTPMGSETHHDGR